MGTRKLPRPSTAAAAAFIALAIPAAARNSSDGLLYTLSGDAPGDRFGASVAGVGDVDGDGCADFVVGAPRAGPNGSSSGSARVFSGRDGSEIRTFSGDSPSDWLGASVSGAGDVDGDGTPDIVVGAPNGDPAAGSASVYSGRNGALLWSWSGAAAGERFGQAVSGLGDVDGDGRDDVAVGAPQSDAAGSNAGRVEVRSGRTGRLLHTFDGAPFDLFGTSLGAAGDVDGDGRADILIGAPLSDAGAFNSGSVYVRSGLNGSLLLAFHGAQIGDQLGHWVSGAGDVDADGEPDLILGAPGADANGIDSGEADVRSSASGELLLAIAGRYSGDLLGAVAGVGDVDADGCADVAVGAASAQGHVSQAGQARLVSGRSGMPLAIRLGRNANDWFGAAVAGVGDVDGDGRPDLAVGAPGHDDVLTETGYVQVFSGRILARDG